jgi:hypothetical protein
MMLGTEEKVILLKPSASSEKGKITYVLMCRNMCRDLLLGEASRYRSKSTSEIVQGNEEKPLGTISMHTATGGSRFVDGIFATFLAYTSVNLHQETCSSPCPLPDDIGNSFATEPQGAQHIQCCQWRAPGKDGILAELLKLIGDEIAKFLLIPLLWLCYSEVMKGIKEQWRQYCSLTNTTCFEVLVETVQEYCLSYTMISCNSNALNTAFSSIVCAGTFSIVKLWGV